MKIDWMRRSPVQSKGVVGSVATVRSAGVARSMATVTSLEISRWAGWARDGRGAAVSVLILG